MKKFKVAMVLIIFTIISGMIWFGTSINTKTEKDYIDYCQSDTMVVGYEYLFTYNDSADMNYSVFNPKYKDMLSQYGKLTYADTLDVFSARGYYLVLRGLDEKIAVTPKESRAIKITPQPTWLGYIRWKDKK